MFRSLSLAIMLCLSATVAAADSPIYARFDMDALIDTQNWDRLGAGHAFLLEGGQMAINDNSNGQFIAFETLSGEIQAKHELRFRARLKIVSNVYGDAMAVEIARPGLEAILQLRPTGLLLVQRKADGSYRRLASASVDLSSFRELEFIKGAADAKGQETLRVRIDGKEILSATPKAIGSLGLSRLLIGSLSRPDFGASIWDWIEFERSSPAAAVEVEENSMGSIKALFLPR